MTEFETDLAVYNVTSAISKIQGKDVKWGRVTVGSQFSPSEKDSRGIKFDTYKCDYEASLNMPVELPATVHCRLGVRQTRIEDKTVQEVRVVKVLS